MWDNAAVIDLSAGQLVADKYRIDHVIGAGGMGVVLAATHLDLEQPVAIKVLKVANGDAVARFQREARLIVKLKNVHVARVFDVGVLDDDTPYFVMERLEGEDLSKLLAKRGPLPVEQAVDYVLEACEAIAEAHTLGVVHRDLKPANIFVARGPGGMGSIKVLDFGVSKAPSEGSQVGHLTNEGVALGSPGYMAPEQIESSRDVDTRADIYALGAILYRLTTGSTPYQAQTLVGLIAAMATAKPAPLASVIDVPAEFARVVDQCLEHDPQARPQTVAELARALVAFGTHRAKGSLEQIVATMGEEDDLAVTTERGHDGEVPLPPSTEPLNTTLQVELPRSPLAYAPTIAQPAPRRAPASLLPLVLALGFLAGIVGWVALRERPARPPPPPPPSIVVVEPAPQPTFVAAPAPAPLPVPADPAPVEPPPSPHTRRTPHRPAPAPSPKKTSDSPPNVLDLPGGRH